MKWKSSLTISLFNFDYLPDEDGKKVDTKNADEDENIWNNEFDFWIFHIKIRLYHNFHKNLTRKNLTLFFEIFFTSWGKNESKNEKYWEYESEIRLYDNFHENLFKKKIDPFFRTFLTNRGKNEDEDKKIWENEFNLWILHIEIRLYGNFHENLRRKWNEKVL